VSSFLDVSVKFKEDDEIKEIHEKNCSPVKSFKSTRDLLAQIENHPLLNSKSKVKNLFPVKKKYCEVGDNEL
jgi:hypothetical protein